MNDTDSGGGSGGSGLMTFYFGTCPTFFTSASLASFDPVDDCFQILLGKTCNILLLWGGEG